jgi:hypothetical protein
LIKKDDMKNKKHNCYTCRFRGEVTGSAHSFCRALENIYGEELGEVYGLKYALGGETPRGVALGLHGVANGWAIWPINFDPVWVKECGYYEEQKPEE